MNLSNLKNKPRAIIFDWDNTLVDSWNVIHLSLNATLENYGLTPWTSDETQQRVGKSMRDTFPILFGDKWREAGKYFYDYFETIHLDNLTPLPGTADLLADLVADGVYLGVVSNKQGGYLRKEVEHLEWNGFFGKIIGANDAENDKPAPDPVYLALSGGPVEAGPGVWFVGDSGVDMECAFNTGCVPVFLRKKALSPEEFELKQPVYHVTECRELGKKIKSM